MSNFDILTFKNICSKNNLEEIKEYFKKHKKSKKNSDLMLTEGVQRLFYNGQLEIIKFFLTSPELKKHADIHYLNDVYLAIASIYNHLDVVKYLLTSPELKEHAHLQADNNRAFRSACEAGNVQIMDFFLHDPNLKEHANINDIDFYGWNALMCACDQAKLESLHFLINQKEFDLVKALHQINEDNKNAFVLACENHEYNTDIIDFLLMDCDYQLTKNDYKYMSEICEEPFHLKKDMVLHAKNVLSIRTSYDNMQKTVQNKSKPTTKRKI